MWSATAGQRVGDPGARARARGAVQFGAPRARARVPARQLTARRAVARAPGACAVPAGCAESVRAQVAGIARAPVCQFRGRARARMRWDMRAGVDGWMEMTGSVARDARRFGSSVARRYGTVCARWMRRARARAHELVDPRARMPVPGCARGMRVPDCLDSARAPVARGMRSGPEFTVCRMSVCAMRARDGARAQHARASMRARRAGARAPVTRTRYGMMR